MVENISLRRYHQATLVAACAREDMYFSPTQDNRLMNNGEVGLVSLGAMTGDHIFAQLAPDEIAVMEYAEKIITQSSRVTQADVNHLKAFGLSEAEILDITLIAHAHSFFTKMSQFSIA